jgi:hypothetical protein
LTILNLSENSFTGIPDLSALPNLVELNLALNSLAGSIPLSIMNLLNLEILNLAGNEFNGALSTRFELLVKLTDLDLANNQLTGNIAFLPNIVNIDLSGNLEMIVQLEPEVDEESQILSTSSIIIILVCTGVAIAIVAVLGILLKKRSNRLAEKQRRDERYDESSFMESEGSDKSGIEMDSVASASISGKGNVKQTKRLRITAQLAKGGFGIVYKGRYDGKVIAVKRIIEPTSKGEKLKLAAMFLEEAETMRLMNHERIGKNNVFNR